MITVHHLNNSRSQRILTLLEELELEYKLKCYKRDPQTLLAPQALKEVHPLGKSPVITDGDVTVAESGAIIEYLLETYGQGQLKPVAEADLRNYRYWLHYAEGSLMPLLVMKLVFERIPKGPMPFFIRPIAKSITTKVQETFLDPQLSTHLRFVDESLKDREWFAGEFSAADIQMSFPVEAASPRTDLTPYPNIRTFLERYQARPAYQQAIKKGGVFELMN